MNQPIIDIKNISFQYRESLILKDISLSFEKGGYYVLMGPNGGGKTTLLKLIMGLLSPKSGSIFVQGSKPQEMCCTIGYVPQTLFFDSLFPLTVLECVLMGQLSKLSWYGKYPKAVKESALKLLSSLGILGLKNRTIGSLSGGQRQRTLLARALLCDPDILLLDEPTSGLDMEASTFIQNKLQELKGKKTILMVTHSLSEMTSSIDQAICISTTANLIPNNQLCKHYAMGIYHPGVEL
jgi:zinc transport system ATP-binding protein